MSEMKGDCLSAPGFGISRLSGKAGRDIVYLFERLEAVRCAQLGWCDGDVNWGETYLDRSSR